MKKITTTILLATLGIFAAKADGIDFFHGTWDEALREASATDKIIFIDAYTSWCGPCKMMSAKVFPLKEVGDFYNANFINLKLDMEKDADGRIVRSKFGVSSFPTFLYVDGAGNVVHRAVGAKQPKDFIAQGDFALRKVDKSIELEAAYNGGAREPEFVYKYVKALNKAGKPSLKVANDYLAGQEDLNTPLNLRFILEATTEADSRIFDLLVDKKQQITALTSQDDVDRKIKAACLATVEKAVKFNSPDLVKEAKAKAKHLSTAAVYKTFAAEADMAYYKANRDGAKFAKAASAFLKGADAGAYSKMANETLALFPKDGAAMKKAETWAATAAKMEEKTANYILYAEILLNNNKAEKALQMAEKALALAQKEQIDPSQAGQLVEKLKLSLGKS
jgi:thioredoxin-related protein